MGIPGFKARVRNRNRRRKPSVFIGSSSESRTIVSRLLVALENMFELRPWFHVFEHSEFTLEALVETADEVDAAIFIFAHDDDRQRRGEPEAITRDNVILEYGMFLSALGRKRVWILKEKGIEIPTDLDGLTVSPFASTSEIVTEAALDLCIEQIRKEWKHLERRERPHDPMITDAGVGLLETIHTAKTELDEIITDLRKYGLNGHPHRDGPIQLGSTHHSIRAYSEALNKVRSRFWTTTFLSSGFWINDNAEVIGANRRMLTRVVPNGASVRRLFLLNELSAQEVKSRKQRLIHLRQEGAAHEESRLRRELRVLKQNIGQLAALGCEVRVAYHGGMESADFPKPVRFHPADSELAIYDDFRVDVFGGGRKGTVTDVQIFSRVTDNFEDICAVAETYVDNLWKEAEPAEEFILRLEKAYESARKRIDYASNWLSLYEFTLDSHDEKLKIVEIKRVKDILRENKRWGTIERYLDIGTCTARYPIGLREAVVENGYILGIDEDPDCIRFSLQQVQQKTGRDHRIHLQLLDFMEGELPNGDAFDLITCMLGTISHFGWNRNNHHDDDLQHSLYRMADLLTADGLLVFSCWTEHAIAHQHMLGIYRPHDTHRLMEWTPGREELHERIAKAGLEILDETQLELRLALYVCRRRHSS